MGAMNSNFWLDNGTDVYPMNLRNILFSKLGTATVGTQTYNSEAQIFDASAWDTTASENDTLRVYWQLVPVAGATTTANLKLFRQISHNGGAFTAPVESGYITSAGQFNFTSSGALFAYFSASGSTGVSANSLYPYNSTFLTLKGRVTTSSTAQSIKVFAHTTAGVPTLGHQLLSYYYGNGDAQVGGVDALDGFSFQRTGTKQTTDATQQAITGTGAVLTTTTGQVYQVTADVVGKQSTTNVAGTKIVGTFRNVSGTVTQVGTTQQIAPNQTAGDWGSAGVFATFTVSGADIRVSVQGKAATTIDWRMKMEYITY